MPRSFVMALGLVLAAAVPVSANTFHSSWGPAASSPALKSVGGSIDESGHVLRGTGFTVRRSGTGEYTITFQRGFFKGCVALVATGFGITPAVFGVTQNVCQPQAIFSVDSYNPTTLKPQDASFQFVATEEDGTS